MAILLLLPTVALILLFAWYAYRKAFYSSPACRAGIDDPLKGEQHQAVAENIYRISHIMKRAKFEPVHIEGFDGTRLFGRYYHVSDGAPLEILFHGYRSHPFRDCSGGHALSRKMGYNALVIDQRAHGQSGGTTICFGIKERRDVISWINYANSRFGSETPILLSGLSMGAATVLMAADLELPGNVKAIIADSPYSSPAAILEKVCADEHYPARLCRPFLHLGAFLFGGFRLNETSARKAITGTTVPILLIHGEDDRLVPCSMSKELAGCSDRIQLQTFPDAGHGLCYMVDPMRYERIICQFLLQIPGLGDRINREYVNELFPY